MSMIEISKRLLAVLAGVLVVSAGIGFVMPPIWRMSDWPTQCDMDDRIITYKGESKTGIYTEYYVILDNNSTVWVSPASYIVLSEGDRFNYPICRSRHNASTYPDTYSD